MKEITIIMAGGENFTPSGLMQKYANQTPGVAFRRGPFDTAELIIGGTAYRYHHFSMDPSSTDSIILHLCESSRYKRLNPMCQNCVLLDRECSGTNHKGWAGCVRRRITLREV